MQSPVQGIGHSRQDHSGKPRLLHLEPHDLALDQGAPDKKPRMDSDGTALRFADRVAHANGPS